MNKITINLDALPEDQKKTIEEWVEQSKQEWPQHLDVYYVVDESGKIETMCNHNQAITDDSKFMGNCFRAREEAEAYREHLKVCAELRRVLGSATDRFTAERHGLWGCRLRCENRDTMDAVMQILEYLGAKTDV